MRGIASWPWVAAAVRVVQRLFRNLAPGLPPPCAALASPAPDWPAPRRRHGPRGMGLPPVARPPVPAVSPPCRGPLYRRTL